MSISIGHHLSNTLAKHIHLSMIVYNPIDKCIPPASL